MLKLKVTQVSSIIFAGSSIKTPLKGKELRLLLHPTTFSEGRDLIYKPKNSYFSWPNTYTSSNTSPQS